MYVWIVLVFAVLLISLLFSFVVINHEQFFFVMGNYLFLINFLIPYNCVCECAKDAKFTLHNLLHTHSSITK